MMYINIINYLTKDPVGLIILGVMTSLLSSVIYSISQWGINKTIKHCKKRKHISFMVKAAVSFIYGARAAKVHNDKNGALQSFWAVDFVMNALNYMVKIIFVLVCTLIFFYLFPPILYWFLVICSSIWLTILFRGMRLNQKYFDMSLDLMFGKEYLKKEEDGYKEYWKNMEQKHQVDERNKTTNKEKCDE